MKGITYDTGALIAGERNDRRFWGLHEEFLARERNVTVPAPVLAEAWRGGGRQANLSRILTACEVEPMSEQQARRVGELAAAAAHNDIVDVTVVEGALRRGDGVVTSNRGHIAGIAAVASSSIEIHAV